VATGPAGDFAATQLAPGEYTLKIESDAHLLRIARFTVTARQQTQVAVALLPRPAKSSVERRGNELRVRGLGFASGSAELAPGGAQAVAEVADLLLREPSMRRLRIQADGGDGLAFSRALAIKQRLLDAGVPEARLDAVTEPGSKVSLTFSE
jgi:outer membrane protein OmpA-like peptidoglycan-associated protein